MQARDLRSKEMRTNAYLISWLARTGNGANI